MHLDRHVASIRSDGSATVNRPSFMPYDLSLKSAREADADTRLNNLNNFHCWCSARMMSPERRYAKEILGSIGMKHELSEQNRAEIILSFHAVSPADVFRVRRFRDKISYEDVSIHSHTLSDTFVNVSLRGRALISRYTGLIRREELAADLTTSGTAAKAWIRRGGGLNQIRHIPRNKEELFGELNRAAGERLDVMFRQRLNLLRRAAAGR